MVDIGMLIEAVQQRPCLWDQYSKEYYNREQVALSWKEIGSVLGVKYELAKSKWKHLRDNYRAELKKIMKSADDEDEHSRYQTSWVWFDSLFFLRDFVFSKTNRCNRAAAAYEDASTSNMVNIKVEPDLDIDEPSVSSEQSEVLYRGTKEEEYSRKRMITYEADTEEGSKKLKPQEVEDDSYHFVMSILPSLRKLPVESQMLIKAKIHELIYEEYVKSQNDK